MKYLSIISFLILISPNTFSLELPNNLNHDDRINLVKYLGHPSSTKLLSNPYPLGGYPGLEIGYSYEIINTKDISRLGDKTSQQDDLGFSRITIGKGLFNNVDFHLHFSPFNNSENTSGYGGLIKWGFYQGKFFPVNMSLLMHANTLNVGDSFANETVGIELLVGVNVNNFSLYFGGGRIQSEALFMGGSGSQSIINATDPTINSTKNIAIESLKTTHTFIGANLELYNFFVSAQLDRYPDPNYSAKIGLRF